MAKCISILGSTGSIGTQALEVAENLGIGVAALTAGRNMDLLETQVLKFRPRIACIGDERLAAALSGRIRAKGLSTEIVYGNEGLIAAATVAEADTVLTSVVGAAGLLPTLAALGCGKDIAIANKETLVAAGELVTAEAERHDSALLPVDSEHSAIFQCLQASRDGMFEKIILTASGGPFRGWPAESLKSVTPQQALKHPNWNMGGKITIDSATLMNKGLELIEARWLFGAGPDRIKVVVHPQSVIHSMVEFCDGSIIAQLGPPDMRIPIQYALTYPDRKPAPFSKTDLPETGTLTFEEPDITAFPCLALARDALQCGGTMSAVMNAADEVAVMRFLEGKAGFCDIPRIIEKIMGKHTPVQNPALADILDADAWAREEAFNFS